MPPKKLCSSKFRDKDNGSKMEKVEENNYLPPDLVDIVCRKLDFDDFDDLFQFAGVCKSWRIIHKNYWKSFMESQSPLIVETTSRAKKVFSFLSIPNPKIYRSTMPHFWGLSYCGSSTGGYMILADLKKTSALLLVNPFTRRKKEINTTALKGELNAWSCRALLAFAKGSEEFVIVASFRPSFNLHVYQSRNSSWVTYLKMRDPWSRGVLDFAVMHNTIYVLTNKVEIGVLSLNSARVKFLDLKNAPGFPNMRLVTCDGQLLVVNFFPNLFLDVYKIDFSTMEYVKLETLGDIALFCSEDSKCYAFSNPGRWGYDSNSVYDISSSTTGPRCDVYSWNNERKKCMVRDDFGAPTLKRNSSAHWLGWCFPHLHEEEVDYSLVD